MRIITRLLTAVSKADHWEIQQHDKDVEDNACELSGIDLDVYGIAVCERRAVLHATPVPTYIAIAYQHTFRDYAS